MTADVRGKQSCKVLKCTFTKRTFLLRFSLSKQDQYRNGYKLFYRLLNVYFLGKFSDFTSGYLGFMLRFV